MGAERGVAAGELELLVVAVGATDGDDAFAVGGEFDAAGADRSAACEGGAGDEDEESEEGGDLFHEGLLDCVVLD